MFATDAPTLSEFLNAANWEYEEVGFPADLVPFTVGGKPLTYTNEADGIRANVWLTPDRKVVISFLGTQLVGLLDAATNPVFSVGQVLEDAGVASGTITQGERDAAAFAQVVEMEATAAYGIAAQDVYVTGHSLGGIQAEYAAQQTGLGGVAFEATGLPRSATTAGDGTNFLNVVTYGDPVANYASDVPGEQPFAPRYVAGGGGSLPHYGYVAFIGSASDQVPLAEEAQLSAFGALGAGLTAAQYAGNLAAFHLPDVQAHDLGITLTQVPFGDEIGVRTALPLDAAGDTPVQFIAADDAQLSTPQKPNAAVSPTSGPYAGAAAASLSIGGVFAASLIPSVGKHGVLAAPAGNTLSQFLNFYGVSTLTIATVVQTLIAEGVIASR